MCKPKKHIECNVTDEDSQICTTTAGTKCSKTNKIPEPAAGSLTVRTNFCMEIDFKPYQCNSSTYNFSNHHSYECAKMGKKSCIFYKLGGHDNKLSPNETGQWKLFGIIIANVISLILFILLIYLMVRCYRGCPDKVHIKCCTVRNLAQISNPSCIK